MHKNKLKFCTILLYMQNTQKQIEIFVYFLHIDKLHKILFENLYIMPIDFFAGR